MFISRIRYASSQSHSTPSTEEHVFHRRSVLASSWLQPRSRTVQSPFLRNPFILTLRDTDCRLTNTHFSSPTVSFDTTSSQVYSIARMETLTTHPSTAQQATAFTSPASLSFPGGAGELTPPSEKDGNSQAKGESGAYQNGQQQQKGVDASSNGNGVTPTTPAATPGAGQGVSGLGKGLML